MSAKPRRKGLAVSSGLTTHPDESAFAEVAEMIASSRTKALVAVNTALVDLYFRVGESISKRIQGEGWGKGTVTSLAAYVQERHPGIRGFSAQNLWRMQQFFEAYREHPKLSTLLRELPWSSNLVILSRAKRAEEREFYVRAAIQQRWSVRELSRQIDGALFERAVLSPPKLSTALRETHPGAENVFRDAYMVEFLELPEAESWVVLPGGRSHRSRSPQRLATEPSALFGRARP